MERGNERERAQAARYRAKQREAALLSEAQRGFLDRLPAAVPADRVLVHNHVRPTRKLGSRGFRAWLTAPDPEKLEVCDCGWAPELSQHFRVVGGR